MTPRLLTYDDINEVIIVGTNSQIGDSQNMFNVSKAYSELPAGASAVKVTLVNNKNLISIEVKSPDDGNIEKVTDIEIEGANYTVSEAVSWNCSVPLNIIIKYQK